MHHPTDRIIHTTAFFTPVVEHWLEREIAQWIHSMKDRSDDSSHHERTLLPRSYIPLMVQCIATLRQIPHTEIDDSLNLELLGANIFASLRSAILKVFLPHLKKYSFAHAVPRCCPVILGSIPISRPFIFFLLLYIICYETC